MTFVWRIYCFGNVGRKPQKEIYLSKPRCQRHDLIFGHINSQNTAEMSETKWYKSRTLWQELLGPYKYITVITFVKWTFYLEEDIAEGSIYHRRGMRAEADYYSMLYGGCYSTSMADNFICLTATMKLECSLYDWIHN